MVETVSVSLSGSAFSSLLYENVKNKYTQEGFLLGDIIINKTSTITDNVQRQLNVSTVIKVNSVIPCPRTCYFYDAVGRVDLETIRNFLGELTSKVVAWFKYRPSGGFTFTFREKIIHRQLSEMFEVPSEFFTCCMLISESSDNASTHAFTQNFVRSHSHAFEKLPLHIVNLSDASNTYKATEEVSEAFLAKLRINLARSQGLSTITKIQDALQKYSEKVVDQLSEAEVRLFQLEDEVKELMERRVSSKEGHRNSSGTDSDLQSPVKSEHLNSASNKDTRFCEVIMDDAKSPELNEPFITKNTRGRRKTSGPRRENPSRKNNAEGNHEISTRSRKRN